MYDENEPVHYGAAHDEEAPLKGQQAAEAPSGYVTLEEMSGTRGKRPLLRFLAAGMLVAAVVLMVFFVASGALGRWFGVDQCEGGAEECDLRTVVNSFCPAPVPCVESEDCDSGFQCLDKETKELGIECGDGGCVCQQNLCEVSELEGGGTKVSLGGIDIGAAGGKKLAKPLKWDDSVKEVQLWETEIGDEGGAAIAKALKQNDSIESINLSGNGLTDDVCDELGEAIAVNTKVVQMDLSDNLIANDGAQHLAEALKQNNSLRIFNLWKNLIGEQGALYMADAFEYNLDLRKLYLTDNRIDAAGRGSFALTDAADSRDNLEITFETND